MNQCYKEQAEKWASHKHPHLTLSSNTVDQARLASRISDYVDGYEDGRAALLAELEGEFLGIITEDQAELVLKKAKELCGK